MVYATGIHPKWETPNDGGGGKCHYNAEWRGALDSANAKLVEENTNLSKQNQRLIKENDDLQDENSFLNDKVDSLHRVVDNRDRFIHKIQDENSNLHNTIDALDKKIEVWGVGETSETVMMSDANYRKLRDKMTDLEKERDNAFRVLNLRDGRIKQLETRELELAEKIDNRNLPPQDSITDKPRHIKNLGVDRDGNVVVFTHHFDKVRKYEA